MSDVSPLFDYLSRDIDSRKRRQEVTEGAVARKSKIPKIHELLNSNRDLLDACHMQHDKVRAYIYSHNMSDVQKKIVDLTLNCMARTFYADLLDLHRPTILLRNGWTNQATAPVLRFLSGRRIGKSYIMTIIIAALMLYMIGHKFVVFAPSQRQSGWIGTAVQKNIATNAPSYLKKMKSFVEGRIIMMHGIGKQTELLCPPCSEKTIRGINITMAFIDESDFVDYAFFIKTIVPLLLVCKMCMMLVTTLNNNPNVLYQKMFEQPLMPDGGTAFTQWIFKFMCDACKNIDAPSCDHQEETRPDWNPEENRKRVEHLLRNDRDVFEVEVNAMNTGLSTAVLNPRHVERLFDRNTHMSRQLNEPYFYPRTVYISVDPNAGKIRDTPGPPTSNYAVISFYQIANGPHVLLGAENINHWDYKVYHPFIVKHVQRLLDNPKLSQARYVFMVENKTHNEAEYLKDMMATKFPNQVANKQFYWMHFGENLKHGIPMDEQTKTRCVFNLKRVFEDDMIYLDCNFFSEWIVMEKNELGKPKTIDDVLKEFKKQLECFSAVRRLMPHGKQAQTYYSGKLQKGNQDDLVMSLAIGAEFARSYQLSSPVV